MDVLTAMPVWAAALLIYLLRVVDVSMGTMRTIAVVQGRIRLSVFFGFIEVLVWITAISQIFANLDRSLWLLFAYAAGFATGNATGIFLERKIALGRVMIRLVSASSGEAIREAWEREGARVVSVAGRGRAGEETVLLGECARRRVAEFVTMAARIDPAAVATIDPTLTREPLFRQPLPHATGWRATFARK